MKKFLFLAVLAAVLMSFTFPGPPAVPVAGNQPLDELARDKYIDLTLHSNNGCTIRIVGNLSYTLLGFAVTGFTGQIIISGQGTCPNTTLTVSYAVRTAAPGYTGMFVDKPELCSVTSVKWFPSDKRVNDLLNDKAVSDALVQEMKKGVCTNADIQ